MLLQNAAGEGTVNRIDSVAITSNGGGITYSNAVSAGNSYAQNFIALSLAAGQTILTSTNEQGPGDTSVLTLGGLSSSGNSTIAFMGQNLGVNGTQNSIQITGLSATPNGQIIGPWATTGASNPSDYAVYGANGITAANIAASPETTWTDGSATGNYTMGATTALSADRTINTLRASATGGSGLELGNYVLNTQGILNAGPLSITATGSGYVTAGSTSGATLYLTSGGGDLSISAPIEDNAGGPLNVVVSGAARVVLSGVNTFTGQIVVNGGMLSVTNNNQLGASYDAGTVFSPLDLEGGTLQALATFSLDDGGTPPTYRNVLLGLSGGGLAAASGSTLTVDGLVSGSGGLTASGPGTIVLANTSNTYAGGTTIAGGVLNVGADGSLGATPSDIVFTANSVLQAGAALNLSVNRTIDLNTGVTATLDTNGNNVTINGQIAGRGNLTIINSGTVSLTNTNTFTGVTLVAGGTLQLGSDMALQESTLDTSGSGSVSFGTLTDATLGGLQGSGSLVLQNAASQSVALAVGNNQADTTFSGMLSGSGSLTKIGGGWLVLAAADTYTGGTVVADGTLDVVTSSALPDGTSLAIGADATLVFDPTGAGVPVASAAVVQAVPEPSTLALLAAGVVVTLLARKRRSRKRVD